jgi:hypothetical protein
MNEVLHIYLDESGDLGYRPGSSSCFILCALVTTDPVRIRRVVKKAREKYLGRSLRDSAELKFTASSPSMRIGLLGMLAKENIVAYYLSLGKSMPPVGETPRYAERYARLTEHLLTRITGRRARKYILFVDRCMGKTSRGHFNDILSSGSGHFGVCASAPINLQILHLSSQAEPCLQCADFISGAIFAERERADARFLDVIRSRTSEVVLRKKW